VSLRNRTKWNLRWICSFSDIASPLKASSHRHHCVCLYVWMYCAVCTSQTAKGIGVGTGLELWPCPIGSIVIYSWCMLVSCVCAKKAALECRVYLSRQSFNLSMSFNVFQTLTLSHPVSLGAFAISARFGVPASIQNVGRRQIRRWGCSLIYHIHIITYIYIYTHKFNYVCIYIYIHGLYGLQIIKHLLSGMHIQVCGR